ncbi:MAG TPA: hypothetical protein VGP47_03555, partial [Parachlamydiaceae bacterium]|nr:hypothetical protein [Parachlamydiaceae bacterium]
HGNVRGILLDAGHAVTTTNVETIAACLKETLAKEAPIFLNSCNTGKARAGNRLNFAERLASETEHPIFASALTSYRSECRIEYGSNSGASPNPIYSCVFDFDYRGSSIFVPHILNPATLNAAEYNRLIERTKDERDESTAQDDRLYTLFCNRISELVPIDVWSKLASTKLWKDLKRWWEKI